MAPPQPKLEPRCNESRLSPAIDVPLVRALSVEARQAQAVAWREVRVAEAQEVAMSKELAAMQREIDERLDRSGGDL